VRLPGLHYGVRSSYRNGDGLSGPDPTPIKLPEPMHHSPFTDLSRWTVGLRTKLFPKLTFEKFDHLDLLLFSSKNSTCDQIEGPSLRLFWQIHDLWPGWRVYSWRPWQFRWGRDLFVTMWPVTSLKRLVCDQFDKYDYWPVWRIWFVSITKFDKFDLWPVWSAWFVFSLISTTWDEFDNFGSYFAFMNLCIAI